MTIQVPTYWKHVATVLGGALGAQALPLLAAPFITRWCTPAEVGAFSVWLGIVAVAAIGATLMRGATGGLIAVLKFVLRQSWSALANWAEKTATLAVCGTFGSKSAPTELATRA